MDRKEATNASASKCCGACGYDLRGVASSDGRARCPECGLLGAVRGQSDLVACVVCGYDLGGLQNSSELTVGGQGVLPEAKCPECGTNLTKSAGKFYFQLDLARARKVRRWLWWTLAGAGISVGGMLIGFVLGIFVFGSGTGLIGVSVGGLMMMVSWTILVRELRGLDQIGTCRLFFAGYSAVWMWAAAVVFGLMVVLLVNDVRLWPGRGVGGGMPSGIVLIGPLAAFMCLWLVSIARAFELVARATISVGSWRSSRLYWWVTTIWHAGIVLPLVGVLTVLLVLESTRTSATGAGRGYEEWIMYAAGAWFFSFAGHAIWGIWGLVVLIQAYRAVGREINVANSR